MAIRPVRWTRMATSLPLSSTNYPSSSREPTTTRMGVHVISIGENAPIPSQAYQRHGSSTERLWSRLSKAGSRRISDVWQMSCTGMLPFEDDLQCERIAHFLGLENIAFDLTIWAFES
jgi:hypothetical protein